MVKLDINNPFDLVKATDLSDGQIADYFVDFPPGESLLDRIKPRSPMPMILFGGKGSGKTHLMRYLSYPLQRHRYGPGAAGREGIAAEGYLGIYFRCSGLNALRFVGKGQPEDAWQTVFAYYMELWFAQLLLRVIQDLYSDVEEPVSPELIADATRLLDQEPAVRLRSIDELIVYLENLQRQADIAINNCGLSHSLDLQIQATPGHLVFGLPRAFARHLPGLKSSLFLYLIDEFENLTESQQAYIHTLIRERESPATFKVGVRLYGLRTTRTFAAGEENRENSEFEVLRLDAELRERPADSQLKFASNLVRRRLQETGYLPPSVELASVEQWFEVPDEASLVARPVPFVRENKYFRDLEQRLEQALRVGVAPGLTSKSDIASVIEKLRFEEQTLLERANVFLFYRAWAHQENLMITADALADSALRCAAGEQGTRHDVLKHFRSDILAQLLRDTKQPQRYYGFETFVQMSAGLPRCLLTILKHIFTWSLFFGEQPFREGKISSRAQSEGVQQAAEWFFSEARAPGEIGTQVRDGMTRLGQLMRDIRFSDKPSECSLSTFSAELAEATADAILVLHEAENWSMLLRVAGGQHERNTGRVDEKYQVHPILSPRWDLPISRRGALALRGDEITAIFRPASVEAFEVVLRKRVSAMTAPFFGRAQAVGEQGKLPGFK